MGKDQLNPERKDTTMKKILIITALVFLSGCHHYGQSASANEWLEALEYTSGQMQGTNDQQQREYNLEMQQIEYEKQQNIQRAQQQQIIINQQQQILLQQQQNQQNQWNQFGN